jgi:acyl-CoA thioester hydrolase
VPDAQSDGRPRSHRPGSASHEASDLHRTSRDLQPEYAVELQFKVQTYDIDFAGIVSNQVYIRWLEDLRLEFLDTYAPLDRLLADGRVPVLVSTEISYKRALRLFDRPHGRIWMMEVGRVRWTLEAAISNAGALAATARHVCAFVDTSTLRPRAVPSAFRERFHRRESPDATAG